MDTSKCGVGVLTSYDAYIVILRLTNNHITLSSPVIRSTINRDSLDDPFRNEMSLFDLLLALLLFVAQPKRLEEKSSLWTGLYVRTEEAERPTHTKRKNKEAGSTSKRSKQAGPSRAGEGQGANESGEGGEQDQLDVEVRDSPHPSRNWPHTP